MLLYRLVSIEAQVGIVVGLGKPTPQQREDRQGSRQQTHVHYHFKNGDNNALEDRKAQRMKWRGCCLKTEDLTKEQRPAARKLTLESGQAPFSWRFTASDGSASV